MRVDSSIPVHFESFEELEDSRFIKGKIWVMHMGKNHNNSYFRKEIVEDAIPSLANVPVLGFVEIDENNRSDFKGHEQRIVIENDGVEIEYLGRAIGIVPEDNNARFEFKDDGTGVEREYLVCDVLIWTKFKNSAEIIERDGVKNHSMELAPDSIKGQFNRDKVFDFSEFKFEGLCLLNDNIQPAMQGSVLEVFSKSELHNEYKEMLTEFNEFYSKYTEIQSHSNEVDDDNKGGDSVDEKLELFAQFPSLQEEDVAELKANIGNYSLEELNDKLKEMSEQQQFSTASQLQQEIVATLGQFKTTSEGGYEYRAYWYIDHDENRVYAEDADNGYLPVGMSYTANGDYVEIQPDTKKRVKFVPQDMEDGEDVALSFVSTERSEFESSQLKEDVQNDFAQKLEDVQAELDEVKPEFESLKTEKAELEGKLKEYTQENQNDDVDKLKSQVEELSAYRAERERQDKMDVIDKFTQLTDEDKKPFVEEVDKYSKEDLEDKLFAVVGRKGVSNFSKSGSGDQKNIKVALNFNQSKDSNAPDWVGLVEQYKTKNKN